MAIVLGGLWLAKRAQAVQSKKRLVIGTFFSVLVAVLLATWTYAWSFERNLRYEADKIRFAKDKASYESRKDRYLAYRKRVSKPRKPHKPPQKLDFSTLKFPDPLVERRFKWFNKFAESVAQDDWYHRPHFPRNSAEWSSPRNEQNYHQLSSNVYFDSENPNHIIGVWFYGFLRPKEGWSATVRYYTSNELDSGRGEHFSLDFVEYPVAYKKKRIQVDRTGSASYFDWLSVDNLVYKIHVDTSNLTSNLERIQPDADIRRIMESPETFRDFSVDAFERLAEKIETSFADGSAIGRPYVDQEQKGEKVYSDRPMTEMEKKHCLEKAQANLQDRIRLVKDQYQEMYAAANQALPAFEMVSDN